MATMTPAPTVANNRPTRVGVPADRLARHRHRLRLTAGCYAGMVGLVLLAFVLADALPAAVGVPLFVVLALGLVMVAHPAIRVTHRR